MLEKDGAPIAAHYGFSYAESHYGYNGGWDPRYARVTPGRAVLLHAMRCAFEEQAAEFRFLRGGEAYKYWYADEDRPVETIAVVNGLLPRVAFDTYHNVWRLRRASADRKVARARRRLRQPRSILLTSPALELIRSFFDHTA
jgi:CelD/BcsL family acetyltransferase involved in cellulose biosynthesis